MNLKITTLLLLLLIAKGNYGLAQLSEEKIKFYLKTKNFAIDSAAEAVVLYEHINISISQGPETMIEKISVQRTIKIIKLSARDVADIKIGYRQDYELNSLDNIMGCTYNLVGDAIKKTALPRTDVYKNKIIKDKYYTCFSLPDVHEGSIIDYSYEINSPLHYQLPTWHMEEEYPKLYSEYSLYYPTVLEFNSLLQTRQQPLKLNNMDDIDEAPGNFVSCARTSLFADQPNIAVWKRRNMPGFKEEPYLHNSNNLKERMELQIVSYFDGERKNDYMESWDKYNKTEWESEDTRKLLKQYSFMASTINEVIKDAHNDPLNKTRCIYKYVRNNFKVKDNDELQGGSNKKLNIEKTFSKKEGSANEVNSVLIAMLNNAGLDARRLMTSTTDDIAASPVYPIPARLDVAACALWLNGSYIFLDASDKFNPFGTLSPVRYNGYSRIITEKGDTAELTPDMLENRNIYSLKLTLDHAGLAIYELNEKMGIIESAELRRQLHDNSNYKDQYFEHLISGMAENATISSKSLDNVDNPDTNIIVKLNFSVPSGDLPTHYLFNPSLIRFVDKNPLIAAKRHFPIELPYKTNDVFILNVILPQGFETDSMPKPILITLGDTAMIYKKTIAYYPEMHTLQMNALFKTNQLNYGSDNYQHIRNFYEEVIREENKVIEIRKK